MSLCEDIDWSAQVQAAGYKIAYEPASRVYHLHGYGLASFLTRNLGIFLFMSKIELRQMTGYYRRRAGAPPSDAGALSLAALMLVAADLAAAAAFGVWPALAAAAALVLPAAAYYAYCLLKLKALSGAGLAETADFVFGPGCALVGALQNRAEIIPFLRECLPRPPRAVAEIGRGKGGSLALLCRAAAADALVISLDLPGGALSGTIPGLTRGALHRTLLEAMRGPGQDLRLIEGDSRSPAVRTQFARALAGRRLDLLFIDGDHSFAGVRSDFELYAGFVKAGGIVAFHDIQPGCEELGAEVSRFWRESRLPGSRREFIADPAQVSRGIGALRLRA
jgi:predicted O-methyltransferase YrrM